MRETLRRSWKDLVLFGGLALILALVVAGLIGYFVRHELIASRKHSDLTLYANELAACRRGAQLRAEVLEPNQNLTKQIALAAAHFRELAARQENDPDLAAVDHAAARRIRRLARGIRNVPEANCEAVIRKP